MFGKVCRVFLFLFLSVISFAQFLYATPFDINLTLTGFTSDQEAIFTDAENYWESVISGYQDGISITSLDISAESVYMDGVGGVLGSGGPNFITDQGGYTLATSGSMSYDSADLGNFADWELYDTIVHEIAHVIGFGTLWIDNSVYTEGSYKYTGAAALAAYQADNPSATYVPVENDGGAGTAGGHWELDFFPDEMMTGWSLSAPATVSQTTLASFVDIGYVLATTDPEPIESVPEPTTFLFFGCGLIALSGLNRKKSQD